MSSGELPAGPARAGSTGNSAAPPSAAPEGIGRLAAAIDELTVAADPDELVAVLAARDRLDARIADAVARFDSAELWAHDGATSMTRWLVTETRTHDATARHLVRTAHRTRRWSATATAWADGNLSSGQVDTLARGIAARHVALFADHETHLVPALRGLDLTDTAIAIQAWSAHADALLDHEPVEPARSRLHLDVIGERGRLDADLDLDDTAVVAEALRLARRHDDDTDPRRRTRAERDADALVGLCRRALRDHRTPTTTPGRQRPGINIVIDAPALAALELRELGIHPHDDPDELDQLIADRATTPTERAWYEAGLHHLEHNPSSAAATLTGHDLSPTLASAFSCDSTMRRVLTTGSTILDHGRTHPTIPRAVRDTVVLRDRHCRFRGCRRTIDWCEIHHVVPRAAAGPDSLTNCVLLCAYHHHVLHRDGWTAHLAPDGTLHVTDPRHRHWTTRPPGPTNRPPPEPLTYGA